MGWQDDAVVAPKASSWQDDPIVEQQPQTRSMGEELGRQAGLTGRAVANVVTSPLQVGGNILNKAINAMSGKPVVTPFGNFTMPNIPTLEMPSDIINRQLDRFTPTPQSGTEHFTQAVAQSAPAFALPAALGPQVAGNAAVSAAMAPQGQEGSQALWGGGGGAAGQMIGRTASGLVRPTAEAQTLINKGVALTPGQAAGKGSGWNTVEQHLASNPIASPFIRSAQGRALEESNIAAAQSVADIVDKSVRLGKPPREAIETTRELIGKHYDNALSNMDTPAFFPVASLSKRMETFADEFPLLSAKDFRQIEKFVTVRANDLAKQSGGNITGPQLKQLDSELGQHIRNLKTSTNAADKTAAPAWSELQQSLREVMEFAQADPMKQQQLKAANAAYRQLLTLEKALLPGAETFTPRQLSRTLEKAKVRGTELNAISQAMTETLPNTIPNSGTAERLIANALPAMLMGGGYGAQQLGLDTIGTGAMAAGALGSRTGAKLMTGGYGWQRSKLLSDALRKGTPAATRAIAMPTGGQHDTSRD